MRDPTRIKRILALLERLWEQEPDTRLGQLIVNFAYDVTTMRPVNQTTIFYAEDEAWEHAFRQELERRQQATP